MVNMKLQFEALNKKLFYLYVNIKYCDKKKFFGLFRLCCNNGFSNQTWITQFVFWHNIRKYLSAMNNIIFQIFVWLFFYIWYNLISIISVVCCQFVVIFFKIISISSQIRYVFYHLIQKQFTHLRLKIEVLIWRVKYAK